MASSKSKTDGLDFLKTAASHIRGGAVDYVKEVMQVTTSTISGASATVKELNSKMKTTAADIMPKIRGIKSQVNVRSLMNWFTAKEDEYGNNYDSGGLGEWDDNIDESDLLENQISESKANADQISGAITGSIHKSVEAQISMTANIADSIEKQSAVITSGFDTTNATLNKILEVLTKNTSAIIETNLQRREADPTDTMSLNGKFDLSIYKKIVQSNFKSSMVGSTFGLAKAMLPMLFNQGGSVLNARDLVGIAISGGMSRFAPNVEKNLLALDNAVNNVIMESLIRLGNNAGKGGIAGTIGKVFGINSSRDEISTNRSSLSLKSIPFDTITKEAITDAIPGYLRKILVAVGGKDEIYDYRSRSFRTKRDLVESFRKESTYATSGSLVRSSNKIVNSLGNDSWTNMVFDLMMDHLGEEAGAYGNASEIIDKLNDPNFVEDLVIRKLIGSDASSYDKTNAKIFAKRMASINDPTEYEKLSMLAASNNARRNQSLREYVDMADAYGVDLSFIKDNAIDDKNFIKQMYGRNDIRQADTAISDNDTSNFSSGTGYTNKALYEIFRRLDTGINVFQVGSSDRQKKRFKPLGRKHLTAPNGYRSNEISDHVDESNQDVIEDTILNTSTRVNDGDNLLRNNTDAEGNQENLSKRERFARWGKYRGKQFANAIVHGSPEDVKNAFTGSFKDVADIAGNSMKQGISVINEKFANVSGYLGHKMFGTEYTYTEVDPVTKQKVEKTVRKNEKEGGLFGYVTDKVKSMFNIGKDKASNWFSEVAGYFDYEKNDDGSKDAVSKRKMLMRASVGALAGAGLLGGPVGVIMGAIAGNAIGQIPNIGDKLKEKLFGKDKETGKPTGLLSKAADAIITPIQYQFGKTLSFVGDKLKKNLLGPLSDLGFVLKERITSGVSSVFSKFFGGLLKGATKLFGGVTALGGKIVEGVFGVKAGTARTKFGVATGIAGGILNTTNKILAKGTPGLSDKLEDRRSGRNKIIDEQTKKKDEIYGSLKDFKNNKYKKNKDRDELAELSKYTAENNVIEKKIEDSNSKIADNTDKTVKILQDIKDSVTGDKIVPIDGDLKEGARVDAALSGFKPDKEKDDAYVNNAMAAGVTAAMSADSISDKEGNKLNKMIDYSSRSDAKPDVAASDLKSLITMQREDSNIENTEKKSLLEQLLGAAGSIVSNLPGIAIGIAGLLLFLKNPEGVITRISEGLSSLVSIFDKDKRETDPATAGANAITQVLIDSKVDNLADWGNPLKPVYRSTDDGSGAGIKNQAMSGVRNQILFGANLRQALRGNKTSNQYKVASKANKLSQKAIGLGNDAENITKSATLNSEGGILQRGIGWVQSKIASRKADKANQMMEQSDRLAREANESPMTNTARGFGGKVAGIATQYAASKGAGLLVEEGLSALGMSDENAAIAGNVAEGATSAAMTINRIASSVTGKKSWSDKILDGVKKIFDIVQKHAINSKLFKDVGESAAGKVIKEFSDKVMSVLQDKVGDLVQPIIAKTAKATGKTAAAILTSGIAPVVVGFVSGWCGTEHLFGVLPGQADGWMKIVAALVQAVWETFEAIPVAGLVVCGIDIIDGILESSLGTGIRQWIVRFFYTLGGLIKSNDEKLTHLQNNFSSALSKYNEDYDADLSEADFNDLINPEGIMATIWRGKTKHDNNGNLIFDDAGHTWIGGLHSLFERNKSYVKDENGKVLKDEKGNAVIASDRYGNQLMAQDRGEDGLLYNEDGSIKRVNRGFGDWLSKKAGDLGRFFGGGNIYQVDENGQAILDENGNLQVSGKEKDIFGKIAGIFNGTGSEVSYEQKLPTKISDLATRLTSLAKSGSKEDETILDENGKPISVKGIIDGDNGNLTISNASEYTLGVRNRAVNAVMGPLKDISDSIDDNKDTPWKLEGFNDPKEWYKSSVNGSTKKISSFMANIINSLGIAAGEIGVGGPVNASASLAMINDGGGSSDNKGKQSGGGNPLINKPFKITSRFGATSGRPHSGTHAGVDLVPSDGSGMSEVGSRFSGKVVDVKRDIPDSVRAKKVDGKWEFPYDKKMQTGNMVSIQTNDGFIVKNMHLKAGSIPGNIKPGSTINVGDRLGTMGSTGWSTGNHLHYEFRDKNNKPIDPTSSLSNKSTWNKEAESTNNDNSNTISGNSANTDTSSATAYTDTSTVSENTSETQDNRGPLTILLDSLKEVGNKFLSGITGGLIGSSSEENSGNSTSSVAMDSISSGTYLTGNSNSAWLTIVRDVKKLVAEQHPTYDQSKWMKITYNGRTLSVRQDCSGIVCAMLKYYGVMGDNENLNSSALLRSGAIKKGFDLADFPGWEKLVEGDILVTSGHVEIFAKNEGSSHYVYNGGSDKALQTPGASRSSHNTYSKIWRCKEQVSTNPTISDASKIAGSDSDSVFKKLKQLGYSDAASSGVMGVWQEESKNDSKTVEGNYLKGYPGYDTVMSSTDAMNEYVRGVLWPSLKSSGVKINESAYYGKDGNLYPGLGLAQWTGPRHHKLKEYADSVHEDWRDMNTQVEYMDKEKESRGIGDEFKQIDDPETAAEVFARKFEGTNKESWISKRKANAKSFYSHYKNSGDTSNTSETDSMAYTDGEGGPTEDEISSLNSNASYISTPSYNSYSGRRYTGNNQDLSSSIPSISNLVPEKPSVTNSTSQNSVTLDNSEVVSLLRDVLAELRQINGNTGNSTTLLKTIGENGIVDKDLRNQLSSIKPKNPVRTSPTYTTSGPNSSSNNRMISSMIRPS